MDNSLSILLPGTPAASAATPPVAPNPQGLQQLTARVETLEATVSDEGQQLRRLITDLTEVIADLRKTIDTNQALMAVRLYNTHLLDTHQFRVPPGTINFPFEQTSTILDLCYLPCPSFCLLACKRLIHAFLVDRCAPVEISLFGSVQVGDDRVRRQRILDHLGIMRLARIVDGKTDRK
jgi:hypothetical protein